MLLCRCSLVMEEHVAGVGGATLAEKWMLERSVATYSVPKYCHVFMAPPFWMEPRYARQQVLDPCHIRVVDRTTARAIRVWI